MEDASRPAVRARWIVALAIGITSGFLAFAYGLRAGAAPDFIYPWTAARALLAGTNPYVALPGGMAPPFQAPLLYPLPAVLIVAPLAPLPLPLACAVFIGLSSLLLAYAVSRDNWDALLLFLSAPFLLALSLGQWSPMLTATALLPAGALLAIAKPNLGLALTIYRPTRAGLIGCVVLLAFSVLLFPAWPREWMHSLSLDRQSGTHLIPIATPLGPILTLALLRWRRPEARLLLAMACVPQLLFFYDQLPLWLVARTRRENFALTVPSSAALLVWMVLGYGSPSGPRIAEWCVMLSIYLPCLILVLRRPNVGDVPAWIDRSIGRIRSRFTSIQLPQP